MAEKKPEKSGVEERPVEAAPAPKKSGKSSDSNLMAVIAYILGPFAILLYLMKKEDRFVRFHSLQSVFYFVAWFVVFIGFLILSTIIAVVTMGIGSVCYPLSFLILPVAFVGWVYAAYKAYEGEEWEMPLIGEFAKKYV
jgi:uncharacterized membrane protein